LWVEGNCDDQNFPGVTRGAGLRAFATTSFAGGPFGIIHVGKWQGAAYTTDKGAFSHCLAAAKFPNAGGLVIAENADRSWLIGFTNTDLASTNATVLPLVLTFDGQAQFEISAKSAREKILLGPLPNQAVEALRKSHQLIVTANKHTLQFDLGAAGNVVPSVENCVDKMNTSGVASAGDFSNSKGKPAPAKASAKSEDDAAGAPAEQEKLVKVSGSGFVVSKNAHIVTNNHVVGDCVGDIQGNLVGQGSRQIARRLQ
jgi:hypothetical protein